jgi:hypothetical protein
MDVKKMQNLAAIGNNLLAILRAVLIVLRMRFLRKQSSPSRIPCTPHHKAPPVGLRVFRRERGNAILLYPREIDGSP